MDRAVDGPISPCGCVQYMVVESHRSTASQRARQKTLHVHPDTVVAVVGGVTFTQTCYGTNFANHPEQMSFVVTFGFSMHRIGDMLRTKYTVFGHPKNCSIVETQSECRGDNKRNGCNALSFHFLITLRLSRGNRNIFSRYLFKSHCPRQQESLRDTTQTTYYI